MYLLNPSPTNRKRRWDKGQPFLDPLVHRKKGEEQLVRRKLWNNNRIEKITTKTNMQHHQRQDPLTLSKLREAKLYDK
jgi:hypothetical protein